MQRYYPFVNVQTRTTETILFTSIGDYMDYSVTDLTFDVPVYRRFRGQSYLSFSCQKSMPCYRSNAKCQMPNTNCNCVSVCGTGCSLEFNGRIRRKMSASSHFLKPTDFIITRDSCMPHNCNTTRAWSFVERVDSLLSLISHRSRSSSSSTPL